MVQQLHIFFFPFLAHGHMLPSLDMAKVFISRGIKATMITTHYHVPMFEKAIERSKELGFDISVRAIKFPSSDSGLPEGIESFDQLKSDDLLPTFILATTKLQEQLEQLLEECRPHCIVADMFFPWATEAAAKFDIPRLVFGGTSTFAMSAMESLRRNRPYDHVSSDSEPFVVPEIPHEIKMTRGEISVFERQRDEQDTDLTRLFNRVRESDVNCYGVVVNSFYELEKDYIEYYTKKLGRKAWHIGPFLLCNKEVEDKVSRGKKLAIDEHDCLQLLDSKKPNSVVYVCFGSMSNFTVAQLHEIAKGLEASGQDFIWVVRNCVDEEDSEKWFPEGFEERIQGKGLIIKGWAPQLLILEHEAVGTFVTHCGWNSTLEGVCSGVPLVTWPLFAEQFLNDKLLVDVLKIGVAVGAKEWSRVAKNIIKGEALANAVERVMVGEEAVKIRERSKALKEAAKKAIEEGGSSYSDFNALIQELSEYHSKRN
ncbi:OLC1v1003306C1 [Oldenlandia corymbosa var. corymbosa]|uniref:OLC1v1003306C1 n=1 Tax=Oldenlandia corymbosa var. corymbosa TaxID=529605 RepID=A0AAV1D9X7_OLDCO|nr:OLC1v1003306C1 [Oldenlandia corymbosa var. corymbosa]